MDFSFPTRCSIERSDDPTLEKVLEDCEIDAEISVTCEAEYEGAYFSSLQIESLEFHPPDSEGAVKAQALMHQELMEAIQRELERKVQKNWREYETQAAEYYRDLHDAAEDEAYEAYKERGWD